MRLLPVPALIFTTILVGLISSCEPKCNIEEVKLKLVLENTDSIADPAVTGVYAIPINKRLSATDGAYFLPIDLGADSTIFVLERGADRRDTVGLTYYRELDIDRENRGYCVQLFNLNPHRSSSVEFCFKLENNNDNPCAIGTYEIKVYN